MSRDATASIVCRRSRADFDDDDLADKFDTFDEAYAEAMSNWQEEDTLRFWNEPGNPLAIQ